jgi:hypothetical protein
VQAADHAMLDRSPRGTAQESRAIDIASSRDGVPYSPFGESERLVPRPVSCWSRSISTEACALVRFGSTVSPAS